MEIKQLLTKTLLVAVGLLVGQNVCAVDVPAPVYFNDFSSADGLTIQGSGSFTIDNDSRFGKVFSNAASESPRMNYLILPSTVFSAFSDGGGKTAMTISFWVNAKNAGEPSGYTYAPLFAAYSAAPNPNNGSPMICLQSRGKMQINNNGWCDFEPAQNKDGKNTVYNTNAWEAGDANYISGGNWLDDDNWHLYTMTLTASQATIYLDGVVKNQWNLDGSDGQYVSGMFTKSATNLTYVCLGGNQAWDLGDNDAAFMFDDFAVYDAALSAEQIAQIMDKKLNTLLEYGTAEVPWTTGRVAEWNVPVNETYLTSGFDDAVNPSYFSISTKATYNAGYEVTKTISPTSGNIINFEAIWRGRSNTGRYFSNSNGSYFRIGNIVVAQNDQDKKHGYVLTGLNNMASVTSFTAGSYRVDITSSAWLKIEGEINTATNTLTSFTIKSENGTTTYVNLTNQALTSPDYTIIAFGYKKGSSVTTNPNAEQLKSIKITQTLPAATYADYTVHFKDNNGATVKDDVVRNGEVGETVNANSVDKETFYSDGNKYTYKSDGDGVEVVAAGTAELTVVYDKHEGFTATASAVSGGSPLQANIATVSGYEGETKTLQLNKYIKVGETWYSTATCYVDVTEGGDNEVTYTATAAKYFYEFESLTGGRTDETSKSYSGGVRSRVNKSNSLTTPEEIAGGVYTLTIPYSNSNSSAGKLYLYTVKGGVETDTELTIDCPSGNGTVTKIVTIPDGAALRFKNTNDTYNDNGRIDYLILTPRVPVEITSAGWATLYTPYALDFSSLSENLTAYTATLDGNTVKLSKVDNVPANTGVVLEGEAGNYNIPVIASSETEKGDLQGNATAATAFDAFDNTTLYILTLIDNNNVQFNPCNSGEIAAGKAFLKVATGGAKALSVMFANDPTGIATVNAAEVAQPAKRIVNGQLVIEKNGKRFNAAGAEF